MKYLLYIFIIALAFSLGRCSRSPAGNDIKRIDTVATVQVVTRVDVDTQYILCPVPYLAWIDSTDTIHIGDSCCYPREYKEYQDSSYYVRISGIAPRLDEIRVYPKTVYQTQYIYRDIISKPKKWGIGVSAGYGIGKGGFSPILAVTVNYNLLQF